MLSGAVSRAFFGGAPAAFDPYSSTLRSRPQKPFRSGPPGGHLWLSPTLEEVANKKSKYVVGNKFCIAYCKCYVSKRAMAAIGIYFGIQYCTNLFHLP